MARYSHKESQVAEYVLKVLNRAFPAEEIGVQHASFNGRFPSCVLAYLCNAVRNEKISTHGIRLVRLNLLSPQHPGGLQHLSGATILVLAFLQLPGIHRNLSSAQIQLAREKPLPYASE